MLNNLQLADCCIDSYKKQTSASKGVEFLYIEDLDHHVFVIRGTDAGGFFSKKGWVDVVRDLSIWPKPVGETAGHSGFITGWHAIYQSVCEIISKDPDKPIVFAGHSMGGIIALIGAYTLMREGLEIAKVVTFGAPRGMDLSHEDPKGVFRRLEEVTAQYEHPSDPVPGFLAWSRYGHINTIFLDGKYRAPWFNRRVKYHWMGYYRELLRSDWVYEE